MNKTIYPNEINLFFSEIVEKIKEVLDPDYILIAGSFGKQSWLYNKEELISDFEFVFVCKKRWSLKNKKQLQNRLKNKYPYEISLKGYLLDKIQDKVISNYASKNPGYMSLDFFDTFSGPVVLYSKTNKNLYIPCKAEEIPVWEAWRLYVNRMGDLLEIDYSENYDKKISTYYWLKIFESTAGAYCIINKTYHKNILKRQEAFNEELIKSDKELNDICKNSFSIIKNALLARSNHDLSLFEINLNAKERKVIVNAWMHYFEKKLLNEQFSLSNDEDNFNYNYLNNKKLQSKYLGFNYYFNKLMSNTIRLVYNPKLLNTNFKFYTHHYSWRHIILLSIASLFKEQSLESKNFPETKNIATKIITHSSISETNDKEFIKKILSYWKILR